MPIRYKSRFIGKNAARKRSAAAVAEAAHKLTAVGLGWETVVAVDYYHRHHHQRHPRGYYSVCRAWSRVPLKRMSKTKNPRRIETGKYLGILFVSSSSYSFYTIAIVQLLFTSDSPRTWLSLCGTDPLISISPPIKRMQASHPPATAPPPPKLLSSSRK